jgi:acyl carrier protein
MEAKPAGSGELGKSVTRTEFLRDLERELNVTEGSLTEDQTLAGLEGWDSMAAVQFIALADERTGIVISGDRIAKSRTIGDLLSLVGDGLSG